MSFKVSQRYVEAASLANSIPADKFGVITQRILQKLHDKSARLFSEEELSQLQEMFSLSAEALRSVIDVVSYTFEQAAFTSTGPEALFEMLQSVGFDVPHAKLIGRTWAAEAASFVGKLKEQRLGFRSLSNVDYHLNMVVGQSALSRQQDPLAIFELTVDESSKDQEKLIMEFDHGELYAFFTDLERMQQQLDALAK